MTLSTLTIRDFQCHKQMILEIDPQITCITGSSDVGKSAVLRALKWVVTNKPSGDALIRDGARRVVVKLKLKDGTTIKRVRGVGENTYAVNGQTLEAFGNDVPDLVSNKTNVGPINFQGQHDAPFWFAESSGEVSRQLNQIVDLGVIDSVLSHINAGIRQTQAEIDVTRNRLERTKSTRTSLQKFTDMDKSLKIVEGLESEALLKRNKADLASRLVQDVSNLDQARTEAGNRLLAIGLTIRAGDKWAELDRSRQNLSNIIVEAKNHRDLAQGLIMKAEEFEARLQKAIGVKCPLCQRKL